MNDLGSIIKSYDSGALANLSAEELLKCQKICSDHPTIGNANADKIRAIQQLTGHLLSKLSHEQRQQEFLSTVQDWRKVDAIQNDEKHKETQRAARRANTISVLSLLVAGAALLQQTISKPQQPERAMPTQASPALKSTNAPLASPMSTTNTSQTAQPSTTNQPTPKL